MLDQCVEVGSERRALNAGTERGPAAGRQRYAGLDLLRRGGDGALCQPLALVGCVLRLVLRLPLKGVGFLEQRDPLVRVEGAGKVTRLQPLLECIEAAHVAARTYQVALRALEPGRVLERLHGLGHVGFWNAGRTARQGHGIRLAEHVFEGRVGQEGKFAEAVEPVGKRRLEFRALRCVDHLVDRCRCLEAKTLCTARVLLADDKMLGTECRRLDARERALQLLLRLLVGQLAALDFVLDGFDGGLGLHFPVEQAVTCTGARKGLVLGLLLLRQPALLLLLQGDLLVGQAECHIAEACGRLAYLRVGLGRWRDGRALRGAVAEATLRDLGDDVSPQW